MAFKFHAQKIVSLTLVPISCPPKRRYGRNNRIVLRQQDLQPEPVMMCRRKQMVVDLEAGLLLGSAVGSAEISKQVETFHVPKKPAGIDDPFPWDDDGYFTELILDVRNPTGLFLF